MNGAAAEAVAAIRCAPETEVFALRLLGRRTIFEVGVVGAHARRVLRIALQVPLAAIVALAAVPVEEAVLLARVHVVARNSRAERGLVVVEGPGTLGIEPVGQTVAVVVFAVRALRRRPVGENEGNATREAPIDENLPGIRNRVPPAPVAQDPTPVHPPGGRIGVGDHVDLGSAGHQRSQDYQDCSE